jgi:predicted PurR-regulated permease PerM
MPRSIDWAILLIAVIAFTAALYFLRDTLTQFALALILWLGVDGMTRWFKAKIPVMPGWLALPIALFVILALLGLVGWGVAQNVGQVAGQTDIYKQRVDAMTAAVYHFLHLPGPPATISSLMRQSGGGRVLALIANSFQSVAADTMFVLLYLVFLFPAADLMPSKLDRIFPKPDDRAHFAAVITAIRHSMQDYLWVQTILSALISALTFAVLYAIGLPNAMFWSFLIFFLNYVPNIGAVVAVILPTLAALVQFPGDFTRIALVAASVGFWQFAVGSFLQPRIMSASLNLSAVVVLLSLALWGSIWGVTGAFLAAPITVMIMIVLNQFRSTRWIAILLSADGSPRRIRRGAPAPAPAPRT